MSKAAETVQAFRSLRRALAAVDSLEARVAAGLVKLTPAEALVPRPHARRDDLACCASGTCTPAWVDYPAICSVPGCGRQHGWRPTDPAEDWSTADYSVDRMPVAPTMAPYARVFSGETCTPCAEASNRAKWLRHVLRDIAFQHSEAARAEHRFAPGPASDDPRWVPLKTELAMLAPAANRHDAFMRRADVSKDKSYRAYKAHLFTFLHMRKAAFNVAAGSNLDGPARKHDGRLHDDAESLANTVGMALWSWEQLGLAGAGCRDHADRDEGCAACKSVSCGVRPEHVDPRWRRLADLVCRGRPLLGEMQRAVALVAAGHRLGSSPELDDLMRAANDRNDRESVAFARAFRVLWRWNRKHDAECLVLARSAHEQGAVT